VLLTPQALSAQTGVVAGWVIEAASAAPRTGASVGVVGTTSGAIADSGGRFVIPDVTAGTRVLRVRMLGYRQLEREVTVGIPDTLGGMLGIHWGDSVRLAFLSRQVLRDTLDVFRAEVRGDTLVGR
jgi:hypothetical protein